MANLSYLNRGKIMISSILSSRIFKGLFYVLMLFATDIALAADTQTSALPYEGWLKTIQKSMTGPVAYSVSIIGIVACGATLIFAGGEISKFMRSIIYLVLVMGLLIGANTMMSSLFNGATINTGFNLVNRVQNQHNTIKDPFFSKGLEI